MSDLPQAVKERPPSETSVYTQGKLVYDGATKTHILPHSDEKQSQKTHFSGLNEMLKWGIENSNPEQLKKMASQSSSSDDNPHKPKRIDQEVLDLILGQPTVAKMRSCLGVIEENEQVDAQLAALEELEFYVEDIDNANDFAKINGLQTMSKLCSDMKSDAEVRACAAGILGACFQNNPKLQAAADELGLVPQLVQNLWDASLLVKRKVLLAISALLRGAPTRAAVFFSDESAISALHACTSDSTDARLRVRAYRLILALLGEGGISTHTARALFDNEPKQLLDVLDAEDVEMAEVASQLVLALCGDESWSEQLVNSAARLKVVLERARAHPEERCLERVAIEQLVSRMKI